MQNLIEEMYKMLPSLPAEIQRLVPPNLNVIYREYYNEYVKMTQQLNEPLKENPSDDSQSRIVTLTTKTHRYTIFVPASLKSTTTFSEVPTGVKLFGIIEAADRKFKGSFIVNKLSHDSDKFNIEFIEGIIAQNSVIDPQNRAIVSRFGPSLKDLNNLCVNLQDKYTDGSNQYHMQTFFMMNSTTHTKIVTNTAKNTITATIPDNDNTARVLQVSKDEAGKLTLLFYWTKKVDKTTVVMKDRPQFRFVQGGFCGMLEGGDDTSSQGFFERDGGRVKYRGSLRYNFMPFGKGVMSEYGKEGTSATTTIFDGEFVDKVFVKGRITSDRMIVEADFGPDGIKARTKARVLYEAGNAFDSNFQRVKTGQTLDPTQKYYACMYEGEISSLKFSGTGKFYFANGASTEGQFENNHPEGWHNSITPTGESFRVQYKEGVVIQSQDATKSHHAPTPPTQKSNSQSNMNFLPYKDSFLQDRYLQRSLFHFSSIILQRDLKSTWLTPNPRTVSVLKSMNYNPSLNHKFTSISNNPEDKHKSLIPLHPHLLPITKSTGNYPSLLLIKAAKKLL